MYLLDTHIPAWDIAAAERLPWRVRDLLAVGERKGVSSPAGN
jgi:hypothetical protein